MPVVVRAVPEAEYQQWVAANAKPESATEYAAISQ